MPTPSSAMSDADALTSPAMPSWIRAVEQAFREYLGRAHCFLVGRGTTAIGLALKAIERIQGRGEVVLPTMGCPTIAQAIVQAGFVPVFCDVTREDFTLDAASVQAVLTRQTRAILPIHLYGHAAAMDPILDIAAAHGAFVIEDAAQSLGGMYRQRKMGTFGQFSIFSFGGAKIIDVGGGGLIATDDHALAEIVRSEIAKLPAAPPHAAIELKSLSLRNLCHALMDLLRAGTGVNVGPSFTRLLPCFEDLFMHRWMGTRDVCDKLLADLKGLADNNRRRMQIAQMYRERLRHPAIRHPSGVADSGVVWRYTMLIEDPGDAFAVTEALRVQRVHASNHYWSVADLFGSDETLPNAEYVCPRALNLWVDEVATEAYVAKSCEIILQTLNSRRQTKKACWTHVA